MLLNEIKNLEAGRVIDQLEKSKLYEEITTLDDGTICAIGAVEDGCGLFFGLDEHKCATQYVYENRESALAELKKLKTANDKPSGFLKIT